MSTASEDVTQTDVTLGASPPKGVRGRDDEGALTERDTVGRYVIQSRIGRGAMGSVYAAFDPDLDRRVAVKLLHPRRADAKHRERVLHEAQAMARLSHPNVVTVHHVGTHGDDVFIVMALIEGETLKQWLAKQPPMKDIVDVMIGAGRGLAAAHAAGLIHRDFKPDNILVDGRGQAFVTDLGLARDHTTHRAEPTDSGGVSPAASHPQMTHPGSLQGTPAYMSPEQFAGNDLDPRSDQFAYCVVLYEALCGQRPFVGENVVELALTVPKGEIREPPANATITPALRRVIWRGLCADPSKRWPSMPALLEQLAKTRRSRLRYVWPLAILAAGGATWVIAGQASDPPLTDRCEPAFERARAIWSDGRRKAIRERVFATELGIASQTWDRIDAALSSRVQGWEAAYHEACVALRPDDPAVRRAVVQCLHDRLRQTEAFVDVLDEVDRPMLPQTLSGAAALDPLDACGDRQAVQANALSPEDAATVDEVRRTLDHIDALREAGRFADAAALIDASLESAAALPDSRVVLEAKLSAAGVRRELAQWPTAAELLEGAYHGARAARYPDLAFRAAVALARAEVTLDDPDAAQDWARHAQAELGEKPWASRDEVNLLRTQASVDEAAGDVAAAMAKLERALELQLDADPDSLATARVRSELADVARKVGEPDRARAEFTAAAEIRQRHLGDDHPGTALDYEGLAAMDYADGDAVGAVEGLKRVLGIRERAYGPDHPAVASTLSNLAGMLGTVGRTEEALELHRRTLAIYQQADAPDPKSVASATLNYAHTLSALGRKEDALLYIDRAAAMVDGRADAPITSAQLRVNRAAVLRDLERYDEAIVDHHRGLDAFVSLYGESHWRVIAARRNLARTLREAKRYDEAIEVLDDAYAAERGSDSPSHATLSDTLVDKARILGRAGRRSQQIEALELALVEADASADAVRRARARLDLATALSEAKRNRARAIALAEEGLTFVPDGEGARKTQRDLLGEFLRTHRR